MAIFMLLEDKYPACFNGYLILFLILIIIRLLVCGKVQIKEIGIFATWALDAAWGVFRQYCDIFLRILLYVALLFCTHLSFPRTIVQSGVCSQCKIKNK